MIQNFSIFGKEFSAYQIVAIIGILAAGLYACRMIKKKQGDDNEMILFLLCVAGGVFWGGHFLYGITQIPYWGLLASADSVGKFFYTFFILFGGSVFYGGLLGGMLTGLLYIKIKKMPAALYADIMASTVPLFHFFGRIGCFLSGCCYGIPFESGIVYHVAVVESANGIARFPVQLLEAVLNGCLFFFLLYLFQKQYGKGKLFAVYLLLYSIIRFGLEFLRGDEYRGFLWGLSTSQWISVLLFSGAIMFLLLKRKQKAPAKAL